MRTLKLIQSIINNLTAIDGRTWIEIVNGTDERSEAVKAEFDRLCDDGGVYWSLVDGLLKRNNP